MSELITKLARQLREAQVYISTLDYALLSESQRANRAEADLRRLRAQLDDCIPVEVVDEVTISRAPTRRGEESAA